MTINRNVNRDRRVTFLAQSSHSPILVLHLFCYPLCFFAFNVVLSVVHCYRLYFLHTYIRIASPPA